MKGVWEGGAVAPPPRAQLLSLSPLPALSAPGVPTLVPRIAVTGIRLPTSVVERKSKIGWLYLASARGPAF